ncbi:MAG: hypothetical protein LC749_00170 [Actinobacteria bacterium]|nr:hypothetical protein [Actinomycetota bacterium]
MDLAVAYGLLAARVGRQAAASQAGQDGVGQPRSGQPAVGVVAIAKQGAQPVGLPGGRGGQLLAGAQQNPHSLPVPISTGSGQLVGVETECLEHRQVRVDPVGFVLAPAVLAGRLFGLDHGKPRGGRRAGQADAVAAGALDRDHQPRTRGMLNHPGQRLGVAGAVVFDVWVAITAPLGRATST